ncbi:response regulator transcription factor [Lentzea sp. NPDC058450]|uniref:helix-turn-helix transcriptional regulator n=1 Tax=Lentzea sp. NPDC058450 TaxID=3346505 RepID=UPI00366A2DD7
MDTDGSAFAPLDGPIGRATSRLLISAAGGDQDMVRELVLAGLALGELVFHDGFWHWGSTPGSPAARLVALIEAGSARLAPGQLEALDSLTRGPAEPHAAVGRARHGGHQQIELTQREREVLAMLCTDLTAAAIANALGMSPRTVTKHQEHVYRKFGTSTRTGTVLLAQRLGLIATHG